MPVLSRFYGIIIRMYFQQSEHNPPHFHAIYGEHVAAISIKDGKILGTQVSAVDGFTDPYLGMTDSQKEELAGIYRNLIGKLLSCDLDDKC